METIIYSFRNFALTQPDKPLIFIGNISLTYGQLWRSAVRTAGWLVGQGVRPGHRVIMSVSHKSASFVIAYFGTHLAGAVAVPVDEKAGELTKHSIAKQVEPAFELSDEMLAAIDELNVDCSVEEITESLPPIRQDDLADILFTSGTTGFPKGVVLTHGGIAAAARNINAFIGNQIDDKEVVSVPLSHSFGLGRLRCAITTGSTLIVVPGLTFPALVFKALEVHRASGLACVPAGVAVLLKSGGDRLAAYAEHLRYMEIGSAPMPIGMKHELMRLLPATRICMHYGLTEASRSAFIEFHTDEQKLDSVGKPSPNVEIAIHDDADCSVLPGVVGRIKVRAASLMKEYWRNPELTAQVMGPSGWLDTRDLGAFDGQGYLYLKGRKDDVINVGGKKVYPSTVENAAAELSSIAEAACIGEPDQMLGEVPVLFVVYSIKGGLSETELLQFLSTRLDPHAMPKKVHFVADLPKTSSGKLQRAELRREAQGIDQG